MRGIYTKVNGGDRGSSTAEALHVWLAERGIPYRSEDDNYRCGAIEEESRVVDAISRLQNTFVLALKAVLQSHSGRDYRLRGQL